jgi:dephospho-CoA kinase
VVDTSRDLRRKLSDRFGESILDVHGNLRRKKLAALAFADEQSRRALNRLVHPYLLQRLRDYIRQARKVHGLIVIDAALLLNWDMDRRMDYVLVIHASQRDRFERLATRGISRKDALARQRAQLPFKEFKARADRVILNNGTRPDLRRKLQEFIREIKPGVSSAEG